jgi:putative ABC transport system permease protein
VLQIKDICKKYTTGELVQTALDHVSLSFRDNEFVAVLGPSGSGKTTLLNVIGGLDRYDEGDLVIDGTSTKQYKDRDWDAYRSHMIGFVFQSYNLIPHQSILANVELALTISGVAPAERKRRAREALERVGLGDQLHKRPNQLSGGQMQRVAIARALVNDPQILLADEPTGALDSATSVQVMELLKQVAADRLVVMVTHNAELAAKYATRTVCLRDGRVTSDSRPVEPAEEPEAVHRSPGRAAMSFRTALRLSFNNLRTKKARTLLTAFAGSIGIIGIALILALSTGVNNYITNIQKDTMSSYPLTISAKTIDVSGVMALQQSAAKAASEETASDRTGVYADNTQLKTSEAMQSSVTKNDLTDFKKYLDDPDSEIHSYLGENGVVYTYDVRFGVWSQDETGTLVASDADPDETSANSSGYGFGTLMAQRNKTMSAVLTGTPQSSGAENFTQLMAGANGEAVSPVVTDSYDVLYGRWPESCSEVVLVLDKNNAIPTKTLYQLGLLTKDQYTNLEQQAKDGGEPDTPSWSYDEACGHTFSLVPACDQYQKNDDGTYSAVADSGVALDSLLQNAVKLKIVGVVRPKEDASNAALNAAVAYPASLTDYLIQHTDESEIVRAQEQTPDTNVLTGLAFAADTDEEKAAEAKTYLSGLSVSDKASFYAMAMATGAGQTAGGASQATAGTEQTANGAGQASAAAEQSTSGEAQSSAAGQTAAAGQTSETAMAAALDKWLAGSPDQKTLLSVYDQYVAGGSYDDNMQSFGKVSRDAPYSISLYADSFEDKDKLADCITNYNNKVAESERITYTDYVALLTSSITSIINVISYVLIAFVAVSLVVSCIMIGIITHISVLERTKEIGILRALGASKRNVAQVFNAETLLIGLIAGLLGVGISALLTFPINAIIAKLISGQTVKAVLPLPAAAVLVAISVGITMLGGLIPARSAARKDPVIALRTE